MEYGTVKFFNTEKGYGFITPDQRAADVFVHVTAVENGMLDRGERVSYELVQDRHGRNKASAVRVIKKEHEPVRL